MSTNPSTPSVPQGGAPIREYWRVALAAGIAAALLCGCALLPAPFKTVTLIGLAPVAAIFLPTVIFTASKLRCPACRKPLPLAFEGRACPVCQAPLSAVPLTPS